MYSTVGAGSAGLEHADMLQCSTMAGSVHASDAMAIAGVMGRERFASQSMYGMPHHVSCGGRIQFVLPGGRDWERVQLDF